MRRYIAMLAVALQLAPLAALAETAAAVAPSKETAATAPAPEASPSQPAANVAASAPVFTLPDPPSGMCPLDPNQDADRAAISDMHIAAQGSYKLLALSAECQQLKALRAGSTKVRFLSQYATLMAQQNAPVKLNRRATVLALSYAVGLTSAFSSVATEAAQADVPDETRKYRSSYHGIVKQTEDYLIVGSEQRHVARKTDYAVAVVSLITVVDGAIVTANFFAPANDDSSFTTLALQAEAYGKQLIAKNP